MSVSACQMARDMICRSGALLAARELWNVISAWQNGCSPGAAATAAGASKRTATSG